MSQFILTQDNFIDDRALSINFHDRVVQTYKVKRIAVCWVNAAFTSLNGPQRIIIASSDTSSKQTIKEKSIVGTFTNYQTSNQHFSAESPPQVYGDLKNPTGLRIYLFNEKSEPIKRQELQHISICLILLDKMDESFMLNLSGDVVKRGDGYLCTIPLASGLQVPGKMRVGLQDVVIPELTSNESGRVIIGDEGGGVLQTTIRSDLVSTSNLFGDTLLRSFCLPIGRRFYQSPYLILSTAAPGFYNSFTFNIQCVTCDGFKDFSLKGKLNMTLIFSQQ